MSGALRKAWEGVVIKSLTLSWVCLSSVSKEVNCGCFATLTHTQSQSTHTDTHTRARLRLFMEDNCKEKLSIIHHAYRVVHESLTDTECNFEPKTTNSSCVFCFVDSLTELGKWQLQTLPVEKNEPLRSTRQSTLRDRQRAVWTSPPQSKKLLSSAARATQS